MKDAPCLDVIMANKYPTGRPTDPLTNQQNKHHGAASWEASSSPGS